MLSNEYDVISLHQLCCWLKCISSHTLLSVTCAFIAQSAMQVDKSEDISKVTFLHPKQSRERRIMSHRPNKNNTDFSLFWNCSSVVGDARRW